MRQGGKKVVLAAGEAASAREPMGTSEAAHLAAAVLHRRGAAGRKHESDDSSWQPRRQERSRVRALAGGAHLLLYSRSAVTRYVADIGSSADEKEGELGLRAT